MRPAVRQPSSGGGGDRGNSASQPPVRRRLTIAEAGGVAALVLLFGLIAVPLLRDNGLADARTKDLLAVQDAVRRYYFDTHTYPAFAPMASDTVGAEPWELGFLPSGGSVPRFSSINFEATAVKMGSGGVVRLFPDYLSQRPRYAGDLAANGAARWRIDSLGNVRIELDGRSY